MSVPPPCPCVLPLPLTMVEDDGDDWSLFAPRSEVEAMPVSPLAAVLALVKPVDKEPLPTTLTLHDKHLPLPDIIDLCNDEDETNLLKPYTPHISPLLFPSHIEDDITAKEGVEISPISILTQITPIDESSQQPITATNVSSGSVVNENFFTEPHTDVVSTSDPLCSHTPIGFAQGCAVGQFLHPPPPQHHFACHPVIFPLPVDNLNRLCKSHDSDSRTSLPQCPPISLPWTPVTAGEPLTAISVLKHTRDLQIILAAEELPLSNASKAIDQAAEEDVNEQSLLTLHIPILPPSLISILLLQEPGFILHHLVLQIPLFDNLSVRSNSHPVFTHPDTSAETSCLSPDLPIRADPCRTLLVVHNDSFQIDNPSPQCCNHPDHLTHRTGASGKLWTCHDLAWEL
ncbi:hypothetical protein EDB92DRAFT_1812882 [Lactarius akahatsu]|uniref:Uncharacterized protein n=1 Tax=Lactarius akahatsu TaxID=416441 RepID=A0AAD4LRN6_9AGAM|nr:hypothetical protein EDB92DRAFT_1812882 [Lactarius akahatsu]